MRLPRLAINNFQFTLVIFILITIAGIASYINMPRTENPEVVIPGTSIVVIYPGASPADLEQLVAMPIEETINELDDIKSIITSLNDGVAVISVEFYFNTKAKDKYDDVVQKINSIKDELPDEIMSLEILEWTTTDVAMMQIALVSEKTEYNELRDKADKLKKEIEKVKGVKKVKIVACPEEEIRISLDLEKMAQMNIGIDQIANAIKSNNANIPGGSIDISDKSFGIKTSGSYNSLSEIRNTVVHSYQGRLIYLKNIANVEYAYEDDKYFARYSGKRAIFITVEQKKGLNVFKVTDEIMPEIEKFKASLDRDILLHFVFNQADEVDMKIYGFMKNLLQGIALVGLVILLALGIKSSLIVIIAIPLSIIMGLFFVDLSGFGLQQISIAGLVVALGLLVDNSIVMVENINRFISMGYKPKEASIKAASEIGWPIVSATATTALAFIPIIMMPDKAGAFIKSLPITIIATLTVSLLIALTLTPLITSKIFKSRSENPEVNESKGRTKLLRKFVEGPYRKALHYALTHRGITIIMAVSILIFSLYMFRYLGISFFPKADKPQFMLRINLPEGTNLDKTNKAAYYVESILDSIKEVKYYATNVGHGNPRIYYNIWAKNYAKNFAEIFVQLKEYDPEDFDKLITDLRVRFKEIPGLKIRLKEFEQGPPVDAPIVIYLTGKDLDLLREMAEEVENFLEIEDGVVNIENDLSKRRTDIFFNINKEKASLFGVPIFEIDKTIRTAISGSTISKYRDKSGKEFNIVLRLSFEDKIKIEDFDKIYVKSMNGRLIPIMQLATIEFREAPSSIKRFNLNRTATITADIEKGANLDEIMAPVIKKLDNFPFREGYGYHISGELESRQESFGGMLVALIIAIVAIIAVLVLQFKSFIQPIIIFLALPFAMIGMIWALLITGNDFCFTAFIGLISLAGIVINNSIILVDYTNKLRSKGVSISEALQQAGEIRFTPIILTTLTTIGGLLPLTLSGGTLWAPLGWTIIGGLLVSTMLTLIVIPVMYKIFIR